MLLELPAGVQTTASEENLQCLFDDWEPAILKLSKKDPNFIFTCLEAVLSKIQGHYSKEYYIGIHICPLLIIILSTSGILRCLLIQIVLQ